MRREFLKKFVEFGLLGGGIWFLSGTVIEHYYSQLVAGLTPERQGQIPAVYGGIVEWTLIIAWVILCTFLRAYFGTSREFSSKFWIKVSLFGNNYFVDRTHELKKATLTTFLCNIEAHHKAIVDVLASLLDVLEDGYRAGEVRITLMVPEARDDGVAKLYIKFWANKTHQAPNTYRRGFGFRIGEGYAGYAWQQGVAQLGHKKKWLILPDVRYVETSPEQKARQSFLSIPIFDEGPEETMRPLLGVLNIDSEKRFYFPRSGKMPEMLDAIRIFIAALVFHLNMHDNLVEQGQKEVIPAS